MKESPKNQNGGGLERSTHDSLKNLLLNAMESNPKMAEEFRTKKLWEKTVPQEVLNHTCNMYVEVRGVCKKLIICVDSSHWAAELNARSLELLTSVNKGVLKEDTSRKQYTALYFKVSHTSAKRKEYRQESQVIRSYLEPAQPVRLSEKEESEVIEIVKAIKNEDLKKAVNKAMILNLEWVKGIKAVEES